MRPPARLRRTYFDCRYGQLHVHQAIPPGGGFDEATALLCVPGRRGLGRFFQPLFGTLGADRSIYAPDLPGHGASDAADSAASAEQYALAFLDLLDSLRQRRVDLLAQAEGADTAVALTQLRPGTLVRRMVFSAAPASALAWARENAILFRELPLAQADADAIAVPAVASQLNELVEFLGN